MPAQNVYLSEKQYVKLVHLGMDKNKKVSELIQMAVAEDLVRREAEKAGYNYFKVTIKLKEALEREHVDVESRLWEILEKEAE